MRWWSSSALQAFRKFIVDVPHEYSNVSLPQSGRDLLYLAAGEETLDQDHHPPDDSGRRALPPRQRRPRRRARVERAPILPGLWDLREGFGYGLIRALCAVGFGFVPGLAVRFGDAALSVVSTGLALALLAIVLFLRRVGRPTEWRLLADAVTLFVLVPVLVTASGIEVADARLGGRSTNFLAAVGVTLLIYTIVVVLSTRGGADRNPVSQIGALPGALSIALILLGTDYFSAGALWRGLSIAWMVAAVATVVAIFLSVRARALVAPAAFALVALGMITPDFVGESERSLSSGSAGIAVLTTAIVAVILVLIPTRGGTGVVVAPPRD